MKQQNKRKNALWESVHRVRTVFVGGGTTQYIGITKAAVVFLRRFVFWRKSIVYKERKNRGYRAFRDPKEGISPFLDADKLQKIVKYGHLGARNA